MDNHITDPDEVVKALRAEEAHNSIEDPAPTYGIQETKEALLFIGTLANLAVEWRRMSGNQMLMAVNNLLPAAVPAFVNIGQVPKELGDLDDEERQILVGYLRQILILDPIDEGQEFTIAPSDSAGIDQTVDVSVFLGALASYVVRYKSFSIGAIVSSLTSIAPKLVSALTGIDEIPAELGDLDDNERTLVANAFAQQFDLDNDQIEAVAEKGYEILFMFVQLVNHIKQVRLAGSSDAYEELTAFSFDVILSMVQLINHLRPLLDAPAHAE